MDAALCFCGRHELFMPASRGCRRGSSEQQRALALSWRAIAMAATRRCRNPHATPRRRMTSLTQIALDPVVCARSTATRLKGPSVSSLAAFKPACARTSRSLLLAWAVLQPARVQIGKSGRFGNRPYFNRRSNRAGRPFLPRTRHALATPRIQPAAAYITGEPCFESKAARFS